MSFLKKAVIFSLLVSLNMYASEKVPTQEEVAKLYVATFNRAPDADGLKYWTNDSGLKLSQIAQSFFDQPETKTLYPKGVSNRDFIQSVYKNLFNREPDTAGWNYWEDELNKGSFSKNSFIQAVINGAKNSETSNDLDILSNKTTIGLSFAEAGLKSTSDAKTIMFGITDDKSTLSSVVNSFGIPLYSTANDIYVSTSKELRDALIVSATNGADDVIHIAEGIYKTTDDGHGTFMYSSNETNTLTLKGDSGKVIILSGDSMNQILNHTSTKDTKLFLENITFKDGYNKTSVAGGAVYTKSPIEVTDCSFINNQATQYSEGGAFYSGDSSVVTNSTFTNNSANNGGGFYSQETTVTNSTFTSNTAEDNGGGFYSNGDTKIIETIFTENSTNDSYYGDGGGFYSKGRIITIEKSNFVRNSAKDDGGGFYVDNWYNAYVIITDSNFTYNSAKDDGGGFYSSNNVIIGNTKFERNTAGYTGGGFSGGETTITNSIFKSNTANSNGGSFYSRDILKAHNLLLISNSSGIEVNSAGGIIANSIFKDNDSLAINSSAGNKLTLYNNYIDYYTEVPNAIKIGNIYDDVNLGFVDEENGDYRLSSTSDLIDAGKTHIEGITDIEGLDFLSEDMDNNPRVVGSSIDIGAYEYQK